MRECIYFIREYLRKRKIEINVGRNRKEKQVRHIEK